MSNFCLYCKEPLNSQRAIENGFHIICLKTSSKKILHTKCAYCSKPLVDPKNQSIGYHPFCEDKPINSNIKKTSALNNKKIANDDDLEELDSLVNSQAPVKSTKPKNEDINIWIILTILGLLMMYFGSSSGFNYVTGW